ncbi:MAG: hypothetical protein ABSB96_01065 [Gaiellaceae bacterium]
MEALIELLPGFYTWSDAATWSGRPGKTFKRSGFAVPLPHAGVLALIDPPGLSDRVVDELERLGPPTHVILTCNWHLRESEACRKRWDCELRINELGSATAETEIDGTFRHGDRLWDAIDVIHLPHVYWPEETAFFIAGESSVLVIGDALCGGREDIGVPNGEIGIFSIRHIADTKAARQTLMGLLEIPCAAICFGHGAPVLDDAHGALHRFLKRELRVEPDS